MVLSTACNAPNTSILGIRVLPLIDTGWQRLIGCMSRLLKIIGLFCKRALQKRWYFAKETYNLIIEYSYNAQKTCILGIRVLHLIDTGWQRPIGCIKLRVIFGKRATNYRPLLRKITYKDRAAYGSSPLCSTRWYYLLEAILVFLLLLRNTSAGLALRQERRGRAILFPPWQIAMCVM